MPGRQFLYGDVGNTTVLVVNDLVGLDTGEIKPANVQAWDTNEATTRRNFVANFLGVFAERAGHANGGGAKVNQKVACDWVGDFDCESDDYEIGDLVGPAKAAGNALLANKLKIVTALDEAVGYVVRKAAAATTIQVRILERVTDLLFPASDILKKDGSIALTGDLDLGTNKVTNMAAGGASGDAVEYDQMNTAIADLATALQKDGSVLWTGDQDADSNGLVNLRAPVAAGEAARVDEILTQHTVTLTPGAEDGSDQIDTAIQVKDCKGDNIAHKIELLAWVSATEAAAEEAQTDMSIVAAGTLIKEETANACQRFLTNATGAASVRVQKTGGVADKWLNVRTPDGRITSTNIVFA